MTRIERIRAWRRGHIGETAAAFLLFSKGYRILARRYKTPVGEIDLIARRGKWLVFVEVKVRRNIPEALEAISGNNKSRVMRAARWYLSRPWKTGPGPDPFLRFDAIVLAPPFSIRHIENAWGENF
ncbi:MAG: YraN family protein [Rhodospirillales bacterium]|nr:YraN family protein [Rhodospirillales bacterium]